jgi:hypothetical protein
MESMFEGSPFNQSIGDWDINNIKNIYCLENMFRYTPFSRNLGNWAKQRPDLKLDSYIKPWLLKSYNKWVEYDKG